MIYESFIKTSRGDVAAWRETFKPLATTQRRNGATAQRELNERNQ
jgi:hypothetical protein